MPPRYRPGVLEQVRRGRRGGGDLALPLLGVFSLSFCGAPAFLLGALLFAFKFGALSLELRRAFAFEFGRAVALSLCGAFAFFFGAPSLLFGGHLSLALGGQLSLALGGQLSLALGGLSLALGGQLTLALRSALPGLLRGTFPLLPRAFLLGGAFLFPSGGALALRCVPISSRSAVAPQGAIRPCSALRRYALRRRIAIGLYVEPVGIGDCDCPGRGHARQWRRIVISV